MSTHLGNKEIMAQNIQYYMDLNGKTRKDVCEALGIKYTTLTDWIKGNTYPRIDSIEMMANYFGIEKSDLVENRNKSDLMQEHDEEPQGYYFDDEAAQMAQELFERKELRVLFDASRNVSKEDIEDVAALLEKLKQR